MRQPSVTPKFLNVRTFLEVPFGGIIPKVFHSWLVYSEKIYRLIITFPLTQQTASCSTAGATASLTIASAITAFPETFEHLLLFAVFLEDAS